MSDTTHYTPDMKADADTIRKSVPCRRVRKGGEFVASSDWGMVDCPLCHAAHAASMGSRHSENHLREKP
jgi:hypothetical protein